MIDHLKISLLIPTLNAGEEWLSTLESINNQTAKISSKIIVDSGSSDDTILSAKRNFFEVVQIDKKEFNHGKTRQYLVDLASECDICVFLTQDAVLASTDSIANIVKVFDDPEIGMAYGRQLPHNKAKLLETHARLYNYPDQSTVISIADKDKLGFKMFFCSNSFSAYRTSALKSIGGFPANSIMGEDAIVAAKMLSVGYKKAYVAAATAYHSHSYTLMQEFRRYFDTRVFHEQNKWMLNDFGRPTGEGFKFVRSELKYVIKNDWTIIFKSASSVFYKWMGYNSGRFFKKMPVWLLKKLSMHSSYWK